MIFFFSYEKEKHRQEFSINANEFRMVKKHVSMRPTQWKESADGAGT